MIEVRLPQSGMGMTDGTIIVWHKAIGDVVAKGEILCEIEAAKTMVDMESPESGILHRIVVSVGENVPVNTVIAEIDVETQASGPASAAAAQPPAVNRSPPPPEAPATPPSPVASASTMPAAQIEPSARRLARELSVDLARVIGSGPNGRILSSDVSTYAASGCQVAAASTPVAASRPEDPLATAPGVTEAVHTMTRRTIARRLTESKQQVPHFYVKGRCTVDSLNTLRREINNGAQVKVSVNDLIIRAVALALKAVPDANVSWGEKAMLGYSAVDVAVAVATPRGLVTPIVRHADVKDVRAIALEMKDFVARARDGKLKPAEYQGGTVSVSNMGMLGVEEFSAIINPPQSAIFAVGAAEPSAVVRSGELAIATLMTVTISVDHRAIDGAVAAKLLVAFKQLIESPTLLAN